MMTHERRYLQTSPELSMKRLLALGLPKIFQIAPVFREGDFTPLHRPEFRLLEWYRAGASWTELLDDCEGLLRQILDPRQYGNDAHFERLSVNEAFLRYVGFPIVEALEYAVLRRKALELNLHIHSDDSWDDLFQRFFLVYIEPHLAEVARPIFLTHYPAPLCSLARLCPEDPRLSERFELFVGGMELANGFGELTDPALQRQRFAAERELRRARGLHDYPLDERFLQSLTHIESAAGIALGLERLLMLCFETQNIDDVLCLPWDAV